MLWEKQKRGKQYPNRLQKQRPRVNTVNPFVFHIVSQSVNYLKVVLTGSRIFNYFVKHLTIKQKT
jgi:hypothetical protein